MFRYIISSALVLTCLYSNQTIQAQTSSSIDKAEKKKTPSNDVQVINGRYEHRSKGATAIINTDDNGSRYRLMIDGEVALADDERSITGLTQGGRFEYSRQPKGEAEHRILIRNTNSGQLEGQYWIDGVAQDYATAGKAWLAMHLPEMVNKTGIGAEARAERLFKEGGASKVLAYTATLPGGAGRTKMYRYLLAKETLSTNDMQALLEQVAKAKSSDYELASILTKVPASLLAQPGIGTAYVKAVSSIHSDYEKARTLKHLLSQEQLPLSVLNEVAKGIVTIQSDYEKSRVLSTLASRSQLSDQQFVFAVQALQNVASDYERAKGLSSLLRHESQVVKHFTTFMPLVRHISSDYEKSKVYVKLLDVDGLNADYFVALLKDSEKISSDYEKSKLLQKIAQRMPKDDKNVREAYIQTAKTISSTYEYEKATAIYRQ